MIKVKLIKLKGSDEISDLNNTASEMFAETLRTDLKNIHCKNDNCPSKESTIVVTANMSERGFKTEKIFCCEEFENTIVC